MCYISYYNAAAEERKDSTLATLGIVRDVAERYLTVTSREVRRALLQGYCQGSFTSPAYTVLLQRQVRIDFWRVIWLLRAPLSGSMFSQ